MWNKLFPGILFSFSCSKYFYTKEVSISQKKKQRTGTFHTENGARVYGEERARHLLGLPVFFDLYLRAHDTHKGDTKSIRTHAFVSLSFLPLAFLLLSFHHLRASQSPLVLHVPLSFLGCFPIISLLSRGDLFPFPLWRTATENRETQGDAQTHFLVQGANSSAGKFYYGRKDDSAWNHDLCWKAQIQVTF